MKAISVITSAIRMQATNLKDAGYKDESLALIQVVNRIEANVVNAALYNLTKKEHKETE